VSKIRAPRGEDLARRLDGYQMLSMNVPTGYSHESQNFVNNNDPIRDIPAHLATNVLYAEHDNDRTAEIRDGKILGITMQF